MKKVIIFSLSIVAFLCNCKPNKRCHNSLEIVNNSGGAVYLCYLGQSGNEVVLSVTETLDPGEVFKDAFGKSCIEKTYTDTYRYDFFIVDPSKHNQGPYPMDSLYAKNKILKEYHLTANDIKNYNYKITYP